MSIPAHTRLYESASRFKGLARLVQGALLVASTSSCSDSTAPKDAPPAIVSFDATASSSSAITLTWRVDKDGATGFDIVRATSASDSFKSLTTLAGSARSYDDKALAARSGHCYKIRALRASAQNTSYSSYSSAVCATTKAPSAPPVPPTDLDAEAVDSQTIAVRWKDDARDYSGVRVERAESPDGPWMIIARPEPNELQVLDDGLPSEHRYCYRAIAENEIGASAPSNVDCVVPPASPTDLTVAFQRGPAVLLTWAQHSPSATGYVIERSVNHGGFTPLVRTGVTSTYVDQNVDNGRVYIYAVHAISGDGASGTSNVAAIAIDLTPPVAVRNVTATAAS